MSRIDEPRRAQLGSADRLPGTTPTPTRPGGPCSRDSVSSTWQKATSSMGHDAYKRTSTEGRSGRRRDGSGRDSSASWIGTAGWRHAGLTAPYSVMKAYGEVQVISTDI